MMSEECICGQSIRNNNGMTPPELAASCGFTECAKYLQAASSRQDTLPRGVYDSRPASSNAQVIQETPKDVSAAVINAGLNGGKLPCPSLPATTIPNGLAADTHHDNECEMDDDCDDDAQGVPARHGHGIHSLSEVHSHQAHHAVNGCHLNGNDITIHQGISANLTMVTGKKRSWEDADDLVDPKRVRTVEDAAAHGLRLTVQLEYPSAATATDAFSKHLVTAPQPCSTPGPEPFGRPTPVAGHQVQDFCAQNGWLAQKDGASRGAWGGMEDAVALDEGLLTSSAHEHKQCMTVQQGYDSMFCDAVISHFHGI